MSTSTITKLAPTQVELVIPISAEEMHDAEERAFRRLAKHAKLPGFRPGKVPRKIFEQTYGQASITNEAMEVVVPAVYAKAVREHDLAPVDKPKMELLPEEDGQPVRVKAVVEVRPEIELGEYKGLQIKRSPVSVTDEEVEDSLRSLARQRGILVPVDREARLGDTVTMDYEGKIDGVAFEGGTSQGAQAELSEERFIPGFATGIAGMRAGDNRDVEAIFPDGYQQAELAGKTAVFSIVLHEVKELEVPAVDDDLAKAVSDHERIDDLKADVLKRLASVAESKVRREMGNQIVEKLIEPYEIAIPETLVEREIDGMINDAASFAERMGMSFEQYLTAGEKSETDLRRAYREDALRRVRGTLVLEAVAKAEKIAATPAEIKHEVDSLARQYGQPADRIRAALGNNLGSVAEGIVRNKTVEFLIENANVTEERKADVRGSE